MDRCTSVSRCTSLRYNHVVSILIHTSRTPFLLLHARLILYVMWPSCWMVSCCNSFNFALPEKWPSNLGQDLGISMHSTYIQSRVGNTNVEGFHSDDLSNPNVGSCTVAQLIYI